jgi:sugar transferase (PEP-CTERM system associated)
MLLMAIAEVAILFSSLYFAGYLLFGSLEECQRILGPLAPRAALVSAILLVCLIAMGLYQFHQRLYFSEAAARIMVGVFAGCVSIALICLVFPAMTIGPDVAAVAVVYSLALLLPMRYWFVRHIDENIFRRRTLIYGAGEQARSIYDLRRRADRRGFKVVGQVPANGDYPTSSGTMVEPETSSIAELASELNADEIVVAMDDRRGNLPVRDLLDAKLKGVEVIDLLEFLERESGKIRIDLVKPGWLVFSPGFRRSRVRRLLKRTQDIVVSGVLLVAGLPVMLLVVLAIKFEDGLSAPVFYRQKRVGLGGNPFMLVKFRSMRPDAEADGVAVWAAENDSRITRVGHFLRQSRLDELPQVFNVLLGHMSIVGPRPERPEFVEELKEHIPYYSERHTVRPGVTGWAQLRYSYGATEEDAIEKLQYDLFYIKNLGLRLDIAIILQTVEVVLWGKGAR